MPTNSKQGSLHDGHRKRVKLRFLSEGLDSFSDHQVLELFLFYCFPMKDTNEIAHLMINEFGSLAGLFEASPEEIAKRCKVSEHTAIFISLIPSVARRYSVIKWGEKPQITSSTLAGEYAASLLTGRTHEVFFVICLDSQNKVNHAALVNEGTINQAAVYTRLVVEASIRHKAVNVIIAHNHPGGSLKPSRADIEITVKIKEALKTIEVTLVDHIIAAGDKYFSFAEQNIMPL